MKFEQKRNFNECDLYRLCLEFNDQANLVSDKRNALLQLATEKGEQCGALRDKVADMKLDIQNLVLLVNQIENIAHMLGQDELVENEVMCACATYHSAIPLFRHYGLV